MVQDVGDWRSFYDLTTPQEAAATLREFYGAGAARAAITCAAAAQTDGREQDFKFWMAAFAELRG